MYEGFYGLAASPFLLTPDARFFFGSKAHKRAIAHLTFGLAQAEGFIVITGEVGAGKTTLVERLWSDLDRNTYSMVKIATTRLDGDNLLQLAMAGFGVTSAAGNSKASMLMEFEQMLRARGAEGRRCLLVVDEAQNLPLDALEELRMLSNITGQDTAPLQTILLGQPQFRRMLAGTSLDQLRQRVLASFHLPALAQDETKLYIEHRLSTAGWTGRPVWDDAAFWEVHRETGGIPRRINRLCSRVLVSGALEEREHITRDLVREVAGELAADLEGPLTNAGPIHRNGVRETESAEWPADDLVERVELLERQVSRRERLLQRLTDVLGTRP